MDNTVSEREKFVSSKINLEEIISTAQPMDENLKKVSDTLPSYVDYRQSGHVSSIKDQGYCGSCWAHTTAGVYESFMMLKGEPEYDLSEEYLLECSTKFTQNVQNRSGLISDCNGGILFSAGSLAWSNGIPTQAAYPYRAYNFSGKGYPYTPGICDANQTIMYAHDKTLVKFVFGVNATNDQMKQIIAIGPVATGFYANAEFQAYKGGVFKGCPQSFAESASKINHGVIIVGYDVDGNYIIKNSWGTKWGENGFGVIRKDRDCAITATVLQFQSTAPPGTGVLYYNQEKINKSNEQRIMVSILLLVIMLVTELTL